MACLLGLGFWQLGANASIPTKAWFAQEMMLRAWQRANCELSQPWPWAESWPVARLLAKAGDIDLIVLAGGSDRTLAFGPGHLSASAMPGENGNSVIAGHRDTHFRFLQDLAVGESVQVERADGSTHTFEIIDLDVVDSCRGSLLLDSDVPMLSLITWYPFDASESGGPLRYVVTARKLF